MSPRLSNAYHAWSSAALLRGRHALVVSQPLCRLGLRRARALLLVQCDCRARRAATTAVSFEGLKQLIQITAFASEYAGSRQRELLYGELAALTGLLSLDCPMALQTEGGYKIALYALHVSDAFGIGVLSGSALVNGAPSGLIAARLRCRHHSADGTVEADAVDAGGRRLWHGGTGHEGAFHDHPPRLCRNRHQGSPADSPAGCTRFVVNAKHPEPIAAARCPQSRSSFSAQEGPSPLRHRSIVTITTSTSFLPFLQLPALARLDLRVTLANDIYVFSCRPPVSIDLSCVPQLPALARLDLRRRW